MDRFFYSIKCFSICFFNSFSCYIYCMDKFKNLVFYFSFFLLILSSGKAYSNGGEGDFSDLGKQTVTEVKSGCNYVQHNIAAPVFSELGENVTAVSKVFSNGKKTTGAFFIYAVLSFGLAKLLVSYYSKSNLIVPGLAGTTIIFPFHYFW